MRNKAYPLYDIDPIRDLKDMLRQKQTSVPNKTAFIIPAGQRKATEKTYGDFYREVNTLGTWLFLQGFHGAHIAVIGENSYEWLLAFCAVANGGNVAVPIDRELPQKEIELLIKKADVKAVFAASDCRKLVEKVCDIQIFGMENLEEYIEEGHSAVTAGNRDYMDHIPDVKKPCCILFTSGTSGTSKGVMLSHENLAADINGSCRLFVLEGSTVALLPFHHAFGLVVGVFMVFHYGYPIYINRSLKTVSRSLLEGKPQTLFLVPLFIETFHRQIWATVRKEGKEKALKRLMKFSDFLLRLGIDVREKCFASVRRAFGGKLEYVISGGAGVDPFYIREFRSWGIEILNGYGTTECSPCAAVNRNHHHKDGTVGLPIPGTRVRIAEDGEVLISGAHVMLGYYKEKEATEEVLKDGWYATGDLGYLDSDGFLTLTGRKKNLIILNNGENVSPEELEQDFLKDAAVREALVYAENGVITAEIFPEEDYWGQDWPGKSGSGNTLPGKEAYFQRLMRQINKGRPAYKQVGRIRLRDTEFEKNTSRKIIRRR